MVFWRSKNSNYNNTSGNDRCDWAKKRNPRAPVLWCCLGTILCIKTGVDETHPQIYSIFFNQELLDAFAGFLNVTDPFRFATWAA